MIFTNAKASDIGELKKMWKDIFDDDISYIELFFEYKMKPEYTFVAKDSDNIASVVYSVCSPLLLEDGTIVPAGEGEGNIKYILNELFKEGYDGFISLEPHLGTFEGLADLELDDKMLNLPKGGEGTFTLAFNKLNKIIDDLKGSYKI